MSEWISVNDRLPINNGTEFDRHVSIAVIATDRVNVFECTFEAGKQPSYWGCFSEHGKPNNDITHWMPLPEPPKGG